MATVTQDRKLKSPASPTPKEIDPKLKKLARLMDESISVPGTKLKIGLDGIIGLIPVVGDLATAAMATWTIQEAKRLELPLHKRMKIGWYYLIDFTIGAIPLVGDVFDFGYKANRKSLDVMEKHLEKQRSSR